MKEKWKKDIPNGGKNFHWKRDIPDGSKISHWKKRAVLLLLGIIGLVGAYALARGVSGMLYPGREAAAGETVLQEDSQQPAKEALTEEELLELMAGMKKYIPDAGTQAGEGMEDKSSTGTPTEAGGANPDTDDGVEAGEGIPEGYEIDFEALWEVNKDVYAWITVPGTVIDYPILQHPTDNSRYLNYNIDGSYGYPGCIYTENMNTKDFTDPNTVIYGHNMKNGTMFAGLHQFKSRDFFEEHNEIIIYLPEETLHYKIFAAYIYDDRHLMYSFDFSNPDVFSTYLENIFNIRDMNANIDRDVEVTSEDKILTLVTCVSNQADKRLLVQAVLTTAESG